MASLPASTWTLLDEELRRARTATRLYSVPTAEGSDDLREILSVTLALCDEHVQHYLSVDFHDRSLVRVLPRVTTDREAFCADCVRATGFSYAVHLTYFDPHGTRYGAGEYLTRKTDLGDIREQVYSLFALGFHPGIGFSTSDYRRFTTLIDVPAHPYNFVQMVPARG